MNASDWRVLASCLLDLGQVQDTYRQCASDFFLSAEMSVQQSVKRTDGMPDVDADSVAGDDCVSIQFFRRSDF